MTEKEFCRDHGQCKQMIDHNTQEINYLKEGMDDLQQEIMNIKIQQGRDGEKFNTVFNMIEEIKEYMKQAVSEMQKMNKTIENKMDTRLKEYEQMQNNDEFSKFLKSTAMKFLEWAIVAGVLMYFIYFSKIKMP